jgi:hypothetical protein
MLISIGFITVVLLFLIFRNLNRKKTKKKPNNSIKGPNHLRKNAINFENSSKLFNSLIDSNSWVKQIVSSDGNTLFEIEYCGVPNKFPIEQEGELPSKVEAISITNNERIVLHDGCLYGWDAFVCGNYNWTSSKRNIYKLQYKDKNVFELFVCCRYNFDNFNELKEDADSRGIIEIGNDINKKKVHFTKAFFEGYDSIDIYAISEDKIKVEILSEETA